MRRRGTFDGRRQRAAFDDLLAWRDGALRTRSGRQVEDIAAELGLSRAQFDRYKTGRTPLDSGDFERFAVALETTTDDLIRRCLTEPDTPGVISFHLSEAAIRRRLEQAGAPPDEITDILAELRRREFSDEIMAILVREAVAHVRRRPRTNGTRLRATNG